MREYHLDELATYGHCPMKWRYRYEWRVPYFEADSHEAYSFALRKAIARYVNGVVEDGSTHRYLSSASKNVFQRYMSWYNRQNVFIGNQHGLATMQGDLALDDFYRRVLVDQKFKPIKGSDFQVHAYVDDIMVVGEFDIMLEPRWKDKSKYTIAVCHITNEKSSLNHPRFMPMRYGWTVAALRQHVDPNASIYHGTFSPWSPKGLTLNKNVFSRSQFTGTVRGLVKGIESRAAWQTPHMSRCSKCCYNLVCEAAHSRDLRVSEINEIKERMKRWPGRHASSVAARDRSDDTSKEST